MNESSRLAGQRARQAWRAAFSDSRVGLAALVLAALASLACEFGPVEIGQVEDADAEPGVDTSGGFGRSWSEAQLASGVVELVELGFLDASFWSEDAGTLRLVLRLSPVDGGSLAPGLEAEVVSGAGEVLGFEVEGEAWVFDAVLEPGWELRLASSDALTLELEARSFPP